MAITKRQLGKVIFITLLAILITIFIFLMVFKIDLVKGMSFKIRFDHIGSLTVGGVVRTGGVRIGTVSEIDIDRSDFKSVLVTVMLYPGYKVRRNSRFLVQSGSLIGDQYIEVIPIVEPSTKTGEEEFIQEGEIFSGEPITGFEALLKKGDVLASDLAISIAVLNRTLLSNEANLNAIILNIRQLTDDLKAYFHESSNGKPSLLSKLNTVFNNLEQSTQELNQLLAKLNSSDSILGLLNEKKTRSDLEETLKNLKAISGHLATVSEGLKKIMDDLVPVATPTLSK